jgi:hypothetical protein
MRAPARALVITLALAAASGAAGDPRPQAGKEAAPPAPAGPQAPAAPTAPQAPREPAGELEEFVPSEKVKADDAVAFPVDI